MKSRILPTSLTTLGLCLTLICAPLQALAKRVALVIGNSNYAHTSPLANPRNDAEALAEKLRTLGFTTIEGYDLGIVEMKQKTREFARAVQSADISLFFYAGHGIQVDGKNYLVPVDAQMSDELAIDFEAFPIDMITRQMTYSKGANLIILDACRDNPFESLSRPGPGGATRSIATRGLGEMQVTDTGVGTGIVFATSPGDVAEDGEGNHSPFTEALLTHIGTPNVPFTSVMTSVTGDVYASTNQRQRPWFNQSFTGEVILHAAAVPSAPVAARVLAAPLQPGPDRDAEDERFMFEIARGSDYVEDYRVYLEFYPDGRFARFAEIAIARLTREVGLAPSATRTATPEVTPIAPAPAQVAATGAGAPPSAPVALPETQPASVSRGYDPGAPLVLVPSPAMRAAPATQTTEEALLMDRPKRREVQARLRAVGQNVGVPDGLFGPRTRRGIAGWQTANGLPETGHLNSLQLQLLTVQTEGRFASFLQTKPRAQSAASRQGTGTARSRQTATGLEGFGRKVDGFLSGIGNSITDAVNGN